MPPLLAEPRWAITNPSVTMGDMEPHTGGVSLKNSSLRQMIFPVAAS